MNHNIYMCPYEGSTTLIITAIDVSLGPIDIHDMISMVFRQIWFKFIFLTIIFFSLSLSLPWQQRKSRPEDFLLSFWKGTRPPTKTCKFQIFRLYNVKYMYGARTVKGKVENGNLLISENWVNFWVLLIKKYDIFYKALSTTLRIKVKCVLVLTRKNYFLVLLLQKI